MKLPRPFLSILTILLLTMVFGQSMADQNPSGISAQESNTDVATTVDRLTTALESKGMKVFAVIDHAAGAQVSWR